MINIELNPRTQDIVTYPQPRLKRALCDLLNEHGWVMAFFVMRALDAYAEEAAKIDGADASFAGGWIDGEMWIECAQAVRQALTDLKN
jgi:hypothetical protein